MSSLGFLQQAIIAIVVIAMVLGVGLTATEKFRDTQTANGYAYNATNTILQAMDDIPSWMAVIVVVLVGAVILGMLYLFGNREGAGV